MNTSIDAITSNACVIEPSCKRLDASATISKARQAETDLLVVWYCLMHFARRIA